MKKTDLQKEADRSVEIYNNTPYYKKKYVNNRNNSFAEVKRIYVYLLGNTKGYSSFEKDLREKQPDAKKYRENNIEWHLDVEVIWEMLMAHETMSRIIKAKKIDSYEELCIKAYVY
jgi:hypothetical protein